MGPFLSWNDFIFLLSATFLCLLVQEFWGSAWRQGGWETFYLWKQKSTVYAFYYMAMHKGK